MSLTNLNVRNTHTLDAFSTLNTVGNANTRIALGTTVLTEADLLIMHEEVKHPAVKDVVKVLLFLADSNNALDRYTAVTHKDMPLAKLIMMQNDNDTSVRVAVKKILDWSDE